MCRDSGLTKMGHVALDGTKVQASASKHAAMSYKRMKEAEPKLAAEVDAWFKNAQQGDASDDAEFGKDKRGDEIPAHIQAKVRKLAKVKEGIEHLEEVADTAKERVDAERSEKEKKLGHQLRGRKPKAAEGVPDDKAQYNFTDPESRIMKTRGGYGQCYNGQAVVDADSQVIVAEALLNAASDSNQLIPMLDLTKKNMGELPSQISADAGYCSEANLEALESYDVDAYVATGRQKHGTASPDANRSDRTQARVSAMREKLRAGGWESPYRLRKHTVEPVFGQMKEARGFRRFLTRGIESVKGEWSLLCTTHNLLKLFASRATIAD
jgi:hypothetical protein